MAQNQEKQQQEAEKEAQPVDQAQTSKGADELPVDFKDKYIRAMAEMENVRKRSSRDLEDARRFAITGFAREMLDVSDNLERALTAVGAEEEANEGHLKALREGVGMVQQQLQRIFTQFKIEKTTPDVGDKFDPEKHQAMFEVPTNEHPAGVVAQVMQPGYVIAGRLLRPALVGTAKPLTQGAQAQEPAPLNENNQEQ